MARSIEEFKDKGHNWYAKQSKNALNETFTGSTEAMKNMFQ